MKTLKDFYIFCSASISSCSYIFHTPFNHISANFEEKKGGTHSTPPPTSKESQIVQLDTGFRKKILLKIILPHKVATCAFTI